MSAPIAVDVLAVLAEIRSFMAAAHSEYDSAEKLDAVESAVAELIAAADQVSWSMRGEEDWPRLDAALVRCGGTK